MLMKRLVALILLSCSLSAFADSHSLNGPKNAKWKVECGSCHLAFPPGLLAKSDWKQLMLQLDKHFGVDASVDDADQKEISQFLQRYGAQDGRHSAKSFRISDTSWFKHEHDEVSAKTWKDPAVNSPANCEACHVNGARGDWSEHGIRMPGGRAKEEEDEK
jgi:hypothetical protein